MAYATICGVKKNVTLNERFLPQDKSFDGANAAKEEAHNLLDKTGRDIAAEMLRMNIDAVKCMSLSEKEKATRLGEGMLKKGTNIEVVYNLGFRV
jgi:hypothetical protein